MSDLTCSLCMYRDIWAVGVITYFLLCGYTPFDRDSNLEEMHAILAGDYSFTPEEYWRSISQTARDFVSRCLTVDPSKRMTARQALEHHWLADMREAGEDLLPVIKKNFNARRTLHAAIDTIRAINQLRGGATPTRENGAQGKRKGEREGEGEKKHGQAHQHHYKVGQGQGPEGTYTDGNGHQQHDGNDNKKEMVDGDVDGEGNHKQNDGQNGQANGKQDGATEARQLDSRGDARGQTDEQIKEQERRIFEAQQRLWR